MKEMKEEVDYGGFPLAVVNKAKDDVLELCQSPENQPSQ
jgi:hypothetical protein